MFPYTNWDFIYYQDADDKWHKTEGKVDYNGLYFEEPNGDRTYFKLFEKEAATYGRSGQWTVRFKKTIISAPVTSSSRAFAGTEAGGSSVDTETTKEAHSPPRRSQSKSSTESPTTTVSTRGRRRGSGEGESTTHKRRRTTATTSTTIGAAPSPGEVGKSHRSVDEHHLSRLARLQAEARDPPLIIVQGGSNALKCWRRRFMLKFGHLYLDSTSVFAWVRNIETRKHSSRILVAFKNTEQRATFLSTVSVPKTCSVSFGNLNRL